MGIDSITKISLLKSGKATDTVYLVMFSNGERVTYTKKPLSQNVNDYITICIKYEKAIKSSVPVTSGILETTIYEL
uniref:Uncharacterized protein n=1 Tax=Siphoviridae sp. ctqzz19 TaxID=2825682 RepID=A0A8S5U2B9_9CAUD|nr:MAG TPA: hypothetical protein [Siphoviridae sp. ctqzz19]